MNSIRASGSVASYPENTYILSADMDQHSKKNTRFRDYKEQVAIEREDRSRSLSVRTCRYQAITFLLAYIKIFLLGSITLPFLVWDQETEFKDMFTFNLMLAIGYLLFGNLIDYTFEKKRLTLIVEFAIALLFACNGLVLYFAPVEPFVKNVSFRFTAALSILAAYIELISIFQVVIWFKKRSFGVVMGVLNTAFLAVFIPA